MDNYRQLNAIKIYLRCYQQLKTINDKPTHTYTFVEKIIDCRFGHANFFLSNIYCSEIMLLSQPD